MSDKPFEKVEIDFINDSLNSFIQEWNNHGNNLTAGFELFYDQVIVLGVDESQVDASGCSIDSSVRKMKEIGEELGKDLFNRMLVGVMDGDQLQVLTLAEWQNSGLKNKPVLNNLITTKAELNSNWKVQASTTWLSRFL